MPLQQRYNNRITDAEKEDPATLCRPALPHPVGSHPFLHSVILQQTLIQTGRGWNLVDKVHHFNRFYSKLRDCRGDTSDWMNAENQSDTALLMHLSGRAGRECGR